MNNAVVRMARREVDNSHNDEHYRDSNEEPDQRTRFGFTCRSRGRPATFSLSLRAVTQGGGQCGIAEC
jgi:hypothetical protein